ncbi:MAG: helix-turn-helix domain-containing protein [Victivallales bacterium]|nr:helix-turn-helix domain-containing protein [Victivallales bacterium]
MPNSELVQSLLKGIELLYLLADHPAGLSLSEIALSSGLKKPAVHNLLRTLCSRGFVDRNEDGHYSIGPSLLIIADKARHADKTKSIEKAFMELAKKFPDHVLTLATMTASGIHCTLRMSPDMPGILQHPANRDFMPYSSASAIVLQAADPNMARHIDQLYPFEEFGAGLWGTKEAFEIELEQVAHDCCCARESNGTFAFAFLMPDSHALGFSIVCNSPVSMNAYLEAATAFRRQVWKEIK